MTCRGSHLAGHAANSVESGAGISRLTNSTAAVRLEPASSPPTMMSSPSAKCFSNVSMRFRCRYPRNGRTSKYPHDETDHDTDQLADGPTLRARHPTRSAATQRQHDANEKELGRFDAAARHVRGRFSCSERSPSWRNTDSDASQYGLPSSRLGLIGDTHAGARIVCR